MTATLCAQTNTTGLSGSIVDPSGALIPGATITLANTATNLKKTTKSGSAGEYSFDQILPGNYVVTTQATGFAVTVRRVELLVASPMTLNIKMTMGVMQVVNVDATSSTMNISDASLGTPLSSQKVQTLPYQANNVLSLLSLQAGVITSSRQYANYTLKNGQMIPIPSGQALPTRQFKNWEQEYYVQDQWKVTPSITLTAGVRYIYLQVPYETHGQEVAPTISMNDFLKKRIAAAKIGSTYNTRITYAPAGKANNAPDYWTPQKGNFAPRFAVA